MIRKGAKGYYVVDGYGRKLSEEYATKGEAKKREKELEYERFMKSQLKD